VYALGIDFSNKKHIKDALNLDKKLEHLQNVINSWKRRKLTLLGKINIVKSLGLSKLIYNASVPENVSKQVEKITLTLFGRANPIKLEKKRH